MLARSPTHSFIHRAAEWATDSMLTHLLLIPPLFISYYIFTHPAVCLHRR